MLLQIMIQFEFKVVTPRDGEEHVVTWSMSPNVWSMKRCRTPHKYINHDSTGHLACAPLQLEKYRRQQKHDSCIIVRVKFIISVPFL